MTIKDYLLNKKTSTLEEFSYLVRELPNENPTKVELLKFAFDITSDMSNIYNKGFDDAIKHIESCDSKFLNKKKPPHL